MSEVPMTDEPTCGDNVVKFERKQSNLRSLYASEMTQEEVEAAIYTLDQSAIKQTVPASRPIYILNSVLLALNVTPEMNSLFRSDQSIDPNRKADALHGLNVDKTVSRVRREFDQLAESLGRSEMSDYRQNMMEEVDATLAETNLYRAFSHLINNVPMSRDVRMNGVVQAYRLSYALLYDYILSGQQGQ